MQVTHDKTITIGVSLDAPPIDVLGFDAALIVDSADSSLDGDRFRTYISADGVAADLASGYLSAAHAAALTSAFAQARAPGRVVIAQYDSATEAIEDALDGLPSYAYGIALDSRVETDSQDLIDWCDARDKLALVQSSTVDWKSGAYSGLTGSQAGVVWHDTDTEFADFLWAANRLAFDLDRASPGWDCDVAGVDPYATALTATEFTQLETNNVNVIAPFGSSDTYIANGGVGVTLEGRQISEIVTSHWFKARLQQLVTQERINRSARGETIPVGYDGIGVLQPIVEEIFAIGERFGHFVPGQTVVNSPAPTSADREANRVRVSGSAQLENGAGEFVFDFVFSRQPVTEAA